jgi:predicted flap endonuclease-1-like 5' DNA nuclease
MNQNTILIIGAIVVVVILLFFLLRGRKQKVGFGEQAAPPMAAKAPAKPIAEVKPAPAPAPAPAAAPAAAPAPVAKSAPAPVAEKKEGKGVGSEVSAAIEDVVDQFIGVDAHPSGRDQVSHAGDELTRLKGLGPKAATKLGELGVTTFAQIAAWNEADIDAIDAQLGAFKGRIRRDRWVEQAKFLAKGDVEGFEAAFGKLG